MSNSSLRMNKCSLFFFVIEKRAQELNCQYKPLRNSSKAYTTYLRFGKSHLCHAF